LKHALIIAAMACATGAANAAPSYVGGNGASFTPFLGMGLTYGGDQVGDTVLYENAPSRSLHGGALIDFRAGFEYQTLNSPWSFQMSLGYHVDKASAKNGSVTFNRMPLEVLTHWQVSDSWRFGGGLRKALGTKLHTSGLGDNYAQEQDYKSSVGIVVEAETFFTPKVGMKLRAVSEKYTPQISGKEIDGSHVGVIGVYYFK